MWKELELYLSVMYYTDGSALRNIELLNRHRDGSKAGAGCLGTSKKSIWKKKRVSKE
jgi:hypothetical protein